MGRAAEFSESSIRKARTIVYLFRAAVSHLVADAKKTPPTAAARAMFNDIVTDCVLRSATAPATTTTSGWASQLATLAIEDAVAAITSVSAAAGLIQRGTKVNFDQHASIRIPGHIVDASDAGAWVGESLP